MAGVASLPVADLANTSGVLRTLQAYREDWQCQRANGKMWVAAQAGAFGVLWRERLANMHVDWRCVPMPGFAAS